MFAVLLACLPAALSSPQEPSPHESALLRLRIEGVVMGPDRRPAANCAVWAGDVADPRRVTRTDGLGQFLITVERRQNVALHAQLPGTGLGGVWIDGLASARAFVRIELWPSRVLEGTVRTIDGQPVEGAFVAAMATDSTVLALACAPTTTDARGHFSCEVLGGPLQVRACKPGVGAAATAIDGREAAVALEIDPAEIRTLTVSLADASARQRDAASFLLFAERNDLQLPMPPAAAIARPDAAGRCVWSGLVDGVRLHVLCEMTDAAMPPCGDAVPSGSRDWECKLVVTEVPPPVRGRLCTADGSGIGGVALAAVAANADWPMQRPKVTVTAPDGTFALPAPVRVGEQLLLVSLDDAWATLAEGGNPYAPIVLTHAAAVEHVVTPTPTNWVTGRIVDPDGKPVVGAEVFVARMRQGKVATDQSGNFRFLDVPQTPAHSVMIEVAEPAGFGEWSLVTPRAAAHELGTLQLQPGADIHGRAMDEQGNAVPGARVWVNAGAVPLARWVIADANGDYRCSGLCPGDYYLSAVNAVADVDMGDTVVTLEGAAIRRDILVK